MSGLNKFVGIGNCGRDAEMKYTPSGKAVTNFSIGITARKNDDTLWVECDCWEKLAEIANEYVRKGKQVYVEGSLKLDTYTAKDGTEKTKVKLNVRDLVLLGGRNEAAPQEDPGGLTW